MGATYTRQSSYSDGDVITAAHTNDEFNQLLAAFAASTGHTHDGTAGEGGPITSLFSNVLSFGDGTTDADITITFNANGNDGVLKWMEDEDYFEFSDDILVASTEKLQFRDTALYINSSTDGQLDIVADTEVQIAATTVDINGTVDISGTLTVGGNIVIGSADISEAELEVLDGLTVTTAEVNILDGDTTASSTTLASADRVVVNDAGTMKQVALTDFETYFESTLTSLSVTSVGALNSGSITSGFGNIDTGSSTITTTGLITGGSLDIDDVLINGSTIGHTNDTDLITLANGIATVAGEISVTTLDIGGTDITATAAELNLTDGGSSIGTTAVSDGHGILMNHGGTMAQTTVQTLAAYLDDEITAMPNLVTTAATTVGALNSGSITSGFGAIDNGSSAITTTGTITGGAVTADDVSIDGKVITMTGSTSDTAVLTAGTNGTLDITTTDDAGANANIQITADGTAELAGTTVTLDSSGGITLDADGGTITFADGGASLGTITSSGYSGNAATASVATTVTITDNESTNEDNAIIFGAGGDVDGGNLGLESDGDFTYNPSTGILKVTRVDIAGSGTTNLNIESTNTGSGDGPQIDIYRNSSSPADDDDIAQIRFSGNNDAGEKILYASIFGEIDDVTDGTENGAIVFNLEDDGSLQRMVEFNTNEAVFNTNGLQGVDFRVESDNQTHMLFVDSGANQVKINTSSSFYSGKLIVETTDNSNNLVLASTDSDANVGPVLNMRRDSGSPADNDLLGAITFEGDNDQPSVHTFAQIQARALDVTDGSEDGQLEFIVEKDDTAINVLTIGSSGTVFNEDSADIDFRVESNSFSRMIFVNSDKLLIGGGDSDTPAVDLDVLGEVRASTGILFGTDTASANTLSDYEEGTFVPSQTFSTGDPTAGARAGEGRYVKIGSLVTVMIKINNVLSSGASGDIRINNMPFTSKADAGDGQVSAFVGTASVNNVNYSGSTYCTAELLDNTSIMRITENVDNSARDQLAVGNFTHNSSDIFASVTYQAA